jgi:hypothetical protein
MGGMGMGMGMGVGMGMADWSRGHARFAALQQSFLSVHSSQPAPLVREDSGGDMNYDLLSSAVLDLVLDDPEPATPGAQALGCVCGVGWGGVGVLSGGGDRRGWLAGVLVACCIL